MLAVKSKYHSIQAPLIYKNPVEDLDDTNMAKLVVHSVKLFEKENYMLLPLLEAISHVVRLKDSLMIKVKPVCTLLMRNYLENQKSTNLKTIIHT